MHWHGCASATNETKCPCGSCVADDTVEALAVEAAQNAVEAAPNDPILVVEKMLSDAMNEVVMSVVPNQRALGRVDALTDVLGLLKR